MACQEAHRRTNVSSFELNGPRILAAGQYISQSASPEAHLQWLQPQPFCQRECRIGMLLERLYPLYPVLIAVFSPRTGSKHEVPYGDITFSLGSFMHIK